MTAALGAPSARRRHRRRWLLALAVAAAVGVALVVGALTVLGPVPVPLDVRELSVESRALGRAVPLQAWVPPGTPDDARLPVVILLHGAGGNEATWFAGRVGDPGLRADLVAAELISSGQVPPFVLVAPSIDDSYGVDSPPSNDRWEHGPYEQALRDDLVPALAAVLPVSDDPSHRFIGGLSMGGFAALHLAFRAPELFGGVAALSPAIWLDLPDDRRWIQAPGGDRAGHDPIELAATAPIEGLRLFLGRADRDDAWIVEGTDALVARLAERGSAVPSVIVAGGHDATTWRALTSPMLEALLGG